MNQFESNPRPIPLRNECEFLLLRELAARPQSSQRALAQALGVSVGTVNACLQVLIEQALVIRQPVMRTNQRQAFRYRLTPAGLRVRARAAAGYLREKQRLLDRLALEVELLKNELHTLSGTRAVSGSK